MLRAILYPIPDDFIDDRRLREPVEIPPMQWNIRHMLWVMLLTNALFGTGRMFYQIAAENEPRKMITAKSSQYEVDES